MKKVKYMVVPLFAVLACAVMLLCTGCSGDKDEDAGGVFVSSSASSSYPRGDNEVQFDGTGGESAGGSAAGQESGPAGAEPSSSSASSSAKVVSVPVDSQGFGPTIR